MLRGLGPRHAPTHTQHTRALCFTASCCTFAQSSRSSARSTTAHVFIMAIADAGAAAAANASVRSPTARRPSITLNVRCPRDCYVCLFVLFLLFFSSSVFVLLLSANTPTSQTDARTPTQLHTLFSLYFIAIRNFHEIQLGNTKTAVVIYLQTTHYDLINCIYTFRERIVDFRKIMTIPSLVFLPTVDSLLHLCSL